MENIEFQKGDLVRVIKLDQTEKAYGANEDMVEMIGSIYEIISLNRETISLRPFADSCVYFFRREDLEVVESMDDIVSTAMPNKQMFDPKELLI